MVPPATLLFTALFFSLDFSVVGEKAFVKSLISCFPAEYTI